MKNLVLEVMRPWNHVQKRFRALGFKMSITIKLELKNYDDSFTPRLSSKNVSENVAGRQEIITVEPRLCSSNSFLLSISLSSPCRQNSSPENLNDMSKAEYSG